MMCVYANYPKETFGYLSFLLICIVLVLCLVPLIVVLFSAIHSLDRPTKRHASMLLLFVYPLFMFDVVIRLPPVVHCGNRCVVVLFFSMNGICC